MPDLRDELLDLIDREAFQPVLNKSPDDYDSDNQRQKLKDVQSTTRSTRESYFSQDTAEGVRDEFKGDLSSDAAQDVHSQLRSLGLPTLNDIEGDVEQVWREAHREGG